MSAVQMPLPVGPAVNDPAPNDRARPLLLQVNENGSWRNVLRFDLVDHVDVQRAAVDLFGWAENADKLGLRVVIPEAYPVVLLHWSAARGWVQVDRTGRDALLEPAAAQGAAA